MNTKAYEILDVFLRGLEVFSRKDCGLILAGLRQTESDYIANRLLLQMERHQLVQRQGRGEDARFVVTAPIPKDRTLLDPTEHWNARWDGTWRLLTYDLPEKRRKERTALWRALHQQRLGLLQRSVWIWPHDLEAILQNVLKATGIPECFCGFASDRLFLCTDAEVIEAAWDFERIGQAQQDYLEAMPQFFQPLERNGLKEWARAAQHENNRYKNAFALDPLLPRRLWPKFYDGPAVQRAHVKFQKTLENRLRERP